ncbi:3681_t:CDS:2 [Acaulospora colombiana]|uniref:3681_t:CDS:1 n=1 Tax=Acaulospora colombiana TaxID=27376 RepID=A0ACA9KHQ6_9GLOM|nr:3681_t:CDS:2 [Acaulospora colombiana]
MDLAKEYPKNLYIGIDISEMFPSEVERPSSATFIKANLLDGLPFENNSFDFVYQRFLGISLTEVQWKVKVIPELVRVLKPGGWIEIMEYDLIWFSLGPKTNVMLTKLKNKLQEYGINVIMSRKISELLKANNVHNVETISKSIPLGDWGGKLGRASLDMTPEEYDDCLEGSAREINEYKSYTMSHRYSMLVRYTLLTTL